MIRLYQFPPLFGLPNASPFCMKVENYLRMAGLPYQCPRGVDLRKAPKGKLPYIEDNAITVADSTFIVDYLKAAYGDILDAWLTAEQMATALAFQRMLEENTYWAVLYSRWFEADGWRLTRAAFFGGLKPPLKWIVPQIARRSLRKQFHGHGMGRHTRDEIYAIGKRDVSALADFLGSKPYFMGAQASSLDAVAYAFLANVIEVPLDSDFKCHASRYRNLVAYCERMKANYYSDSASIAP